MIIVVIILLGKYFVVRASRSIDVCIDQLFVILITGVPILDGNERHKRKEDVEQMNAKGRVALVNRVIDD